MRSPQQTPPARVHPQGLPGAVGVLTVFPSPPPGENGERTGRFADSPLSLVRVDSPSIRSRHARGPETRRLRLRQRPLSAGRRRHDEDHDGSPRPRRGSAHRSATGRIATVSQRLPARRMFVRPLGRCLSDLGGPSRTDRGDSCEQPGEQDQEASSHRVEEQDVDQARRGERWRGSVVDR